MSVAFEEIAHVATLAWEKIAGPTVREATSAVAENLHSMAIRFKSLFENGEAAASTNKEILERDVVYYKQQIELSEKLGRNTDMLNMQLKERLATLEQINSSEEKSMQSSMHGVSGATPTKEGQPTGDSDAVLKGQTKLDSELMALRRQRVEDEKRVAEVSIDEHGKMVYGGEVKLQEEIKILHQESAAKIAEINAKIGDTESHASAAAKIKEISADTAAKEMALTDQTKDAKIKSIDEWVKHSKTADEASYRARRASGMKAEIDDKDFGAKAIATHNRVKDASINAFKQIGAGQKTLAQAAKQVVMNEAGDRADAKGQVLFIEGLSTYDYPMMAGGAALIALGSALHAGSSGGGGSPGGSGGGGGGSAGGGGAATQDVAQPEVKAAPKKSVNVNIMGSYFETEQTRTRMMDIIRESGDYTDFNLKQIGQA